MTYYNVKKRLILAYPKFNKKGDASTSPLVKSNIKKL